MATLILHMQVSGLNEHYPKTKLWLNAMKITTERLQKFDYISLYLKKKNKDSENKENL